MGLRQGGYSGLPMKYSPSSYFDHYTQYSESEFPSTSSEDSYGRHRRRRPQFPVIAGVMLVIILIAVAVGVTVYVLRESNNTSTAASSNTGSTSPSTNETAGFVEVTRTIAEVTGEVSFNLTFTPELSDNTSVEYVTFATDVCSDLNISYALQNQTMESCTVSNVRAGSIICDVDARVVTEVYDSAGSHEKATGTLDIATAIRSLVEAIETGQTEAETAIITVEDPPVVQNATVEVTTTLVVFVDEETQETFDGCEVDNGGCEHRCVTSVAVAVTFYCECYTGYTLQPDGFSCSDIDECATDTCQNGATCENLIGSYTCTCVEGYEGITCATDTDECASDHCQNGATCVDEVNSYSCACATGYTGTDCETDIDDCALVTCMNGAECVDLVGGFTCECTSGYTGTLCETDIDECSTALADDCTVDGIGICENTPGSWNCICSDGYFGDNTCLYNHCPLRPDCNFSTVTSASTTMELYPYGASNGDTQIDVTQESYTSSFININSFTFFSTDYSTLRISASGIIWLSDSGFDDVPVLNVMNQCADVGTIYHRVTYDTGLLDQATEDVCRLLTSATYNDLRQDPCSFIATLVIIVTWENVGVDGEGATSTYQAVLVSDMEFSYGIYLYEAVAFSTTGCDFTDEYLGFLDSNNDREFCCYADAADVTALGGLGSLTTASNVGVRGMIVMSYNFLPGENTTLTTPAP